MPSNARSVLERPIVIVGALVAAAAGFWLYFRYRMPPDIVPQGDNSETIAWIGLATAVASMLASVVGLMSKVIGLRESRQKE